MAANLITSNTGEGIVIKRECSQQFSSYATVHFLLYNDFSNTMEITANLSIIIHTYTKITRTFYLFLQAKTLSKLQNAFKIINFDAAFPNLDFDTSSSVKPKKIYMLQYLVYRHPPQRPTISTSFPCHSTTIRPEM